MKAMTSMKAMTEECLIPGEKKDLNLYGAAGKRQMM